MEKITCDFCGAEMNKYMFHYQKQGGRLYFCGEGQAKSYGGDKYDLCPECCQKVVTFIESGGRSLM